MLTLYRAAFAGLLSSGGGCQLSEQGSAPRLRQTVGSALLDGRGLRNSLTKTSRVLLATTRSMSSVHLPTCMAAHS